VANRRSHPTRSILLTARGTLPSLNYVDSQMASWGKNAEWSAVQQILVRCLMRITTTDTNAQHEDVCNYAGKEILPNQLLQIDSRVGSRTLASIVHCHQTRNRHTSNVPQYPNKCHYVLRAPSTLLHSSFARFNLTKPSSFREAHTPFHQSFAAIRFLFLCLTLPTDIWVRFAH
jgi:hypothetical protein